MDVKDRQQQSRKSNGGAVRNQTEGLDCGRYTDVIKSCAVDADIFTLIITGRQEKILKAGRHEAQQTPRKPIWKEANYGKESKT